MQEYSSKTAKHARVKTTQRRTQASHASHSDPPQRTYQLCTVSAIEMNTHDRLFFKYLCSQFHCQHRQGGWGRDAERRWQRHGRQGAPAANIANTRQYRMGSTLLYPAGRRESIHGPCLWQALFGFYVLAKDETFFDAGRSRVRSYAHSPTCTGHVM